MNGSGRNGTDAFLDDLRQLTPYFLMRIPLYGRIVELLAGAFEADRALAARFALAWGSRTFPSIYDRPLLAIAVMRADAIAEEEAHPLWAALGAPRTGDSDLANANANAGALRAALDESRARTWSAMASRIVQTNETSRAVAWLWPALLAGAGSGARTIALADLGCSAGLNLIADSLPAPWIDETGAAIPVATGVRAVLRTGFDAQPLDASRGDDAAWLRACVWAGETDREARLAAGIAAMKRATAAGGPGAPEIVTARASAMPALLAERAARLGPGVLVIAYQSVMREYLQEAERDEMTRGMNELLLSRPGLAAWVELETDTRPAAANDPTRPAAITAHVAARGSDRAAAPRTLVLARCAHHPASLMLFPDAAREFADLLRPA
jgi:hypothetical protein